MGWPNAGTVRGASGGLSRLAAAIGGGDLTEQQAQQKAMEGQSKIGLALSQIRAHDAQAGYDTQRTAGLAARPGQFEEQVALSAGVDVPTLRAFRQKLMGGAPQVPMGPETADGQMGTGTAQFGPDSTSKIAQAMQRLLPVANGGADNADHWAKALGQFRSMDLGDQVLAGQRTAGDVGASQAAIEGKPLMHANEFGSTNLFTGGVNDQGGPAQRFAQYRTAETGKANQQAAQAKAGAVENYAQAAAARARAAESGAAMSKPFEVTGQDDNPVLVQQDRQGNIKPVDGFTPKGGTSKPLPGPVVKQLTEARDNAATIDRLATSFKPAYGDKGVLGMGADLSLAGKGTFGTDKDAVEWWKNYRKQAELVERHALFGAALTPGEQASWRSADIGPGMDAGVIARNLQTRADLAKLMSSNTRQDMIDAGHSEKRVNAIAERNAGAAPAGKQVVRTGVLNGRKVVQYSDGSTDYAD